ncbi:MAG: hypothetical protein WC829_23650 [Hyphomicrobium sp.]|jgi:hypothetical protein
MLLSLTRALALLAFTAASATGALAFDCIEKKCGQMLSCAEAYHHLKVCGEGIRDRDNDGIPCENVCGKTRDEMNRRLGLPPNGEPPSPPPPS